MENKVLKLGGGDPPKIYLLPSIGVLIDGQYNLKRVSM